MAWLVLSGFMYPPGGVEARRLVTDAYGDVCVLVATTKSTRFGGQLMDNDDMGNRSNMDDSSTGMSGGDMDTTDSGLSAGSGSGSGSMSGGMSGGGASGGSTSGGMSGGTMSGGMAGEDDMSSTVGMSGGGMSGGMSDSGGMGSSGGSMS